MYMISFLWIINQGLDEVEDLCQRPASVKTQKCSFPELYFLVLSLPSKLITTNSNTDDHMKEDIIKYLNLI